jgi:hypothetical protein
MHREYEVTTVRATPKGREKATRMVVADKVTLVKGTATFTDETGRIVATIQGVTSIYLP